MPHLRPKRMQSISGSLDVSLAINMPNTVRATFPITPFPNVLKSVTLAQVAAFRLSTGTVGWCGIRCEEEIDSVNNYGEYGLESRHQHTTPSEGQMVPKCNLEELSAAIFAQASHE